MRIDSSGNLLVGKTAESGNTAGHFFNPTGYQRSTRNGSIQILNRISSDGAIIDFQRDGSAVGSIGSYADKIYIGNGDTGLRFVNTSNQIRPFNTSTLADRDAGFSLGSSSARFTDLYLSGGVTLAALGRLIIWMTMRRGLGRLHLLALLVKLGRPTLLNKVIILK